ncbi:MAG: hypothetical protein KAY65_11890 [Planctomycetes bacterium]|nr:hypothetical protein [Planctomycetota bacterium]
MDCNSKTNSRSRWLIATLAVVVILSVGGCGDLIPAKSAGVEATRIIKDLRKVDPPPEPNIPFPQYFKAPPEIIEQMVGGKAEYKLFYFCQHHTSPELQKIVDAQFASIFYDAKAKSTRKVDYTISSNPATNQLIARCPNLEDAESVLEFLRKVDVPPIQVKISCLISEIYADKTLDWETSIEIQDLLGESIWAGPAGRKFTDAIGRLVEEPSIAAFPGASLRDLARSKMGLKVGYLSRSHKFLAVVDMLESEGYLKILMNPTLQVVNGKQAKVMSSQKVPLTKTTFKSTQSDWFESRQEWENVVDSLEITPHVYADGYIGLKTTILLGSALTPEGIKQLPIVTKKEITNEETRIRPGESLIIGGFRKHERRDVIRGIPFLKDIPIIGILFSGRDFEERVVETIFVLTPTISTGGIPREQMMEEVKRKRGEPTKKEEEAKAKDDTGLDPFGFKARAKERQRQLDEAEETRLEAQAEIAVARQTIRDAQARIEKAEAEAELAKVRSDRAVAEAQTIKEEAEKAKAEADAKAKAADEAKAAADKAIADAAKTKAEADAKAKAAEKAQADAAKIAADATKTKEDAQKARADADAKAKEAEQALAQADAKAKAADVAKAEADAKTKAAEQAKAEADAKAEAAENAKAQADAKAEAAEQVIAEAGEAESEPRRPEEDTDSATAKVQEPAPEEDKAAAETPKEDSDKPTAAKPKDDTNKVIAKAQEPASEEDKAAAETPKEDSDKPTAPKPKDTTEKAETKTAKANAEKPKAEAVKPKEGTKELSPRLLMLVFSALTL